MKKIKLFVFFLIVFIFLGVINVNAETVTVYNIDNYKDAIRNEESTVSKIVLGGDLDITSLTDDVININNNMELDLNGYTITIGMSNIELKYFGDYAFTITDSSEANTGTIYSTSYKSHPIFVCTDNNRRNPTLLVEKITVKALEKVDAMIYFLQLIEGYKYDAEINGVKFENSEVLFSFGMPVHQMLDLNIKSAKGTSISRITRSGNDYKVSDILDPTKSELVVNNTTILDPETLLFNYNVIEGFEVRAKDGFEVSNVNFDTEYYNYSSINAKPITIKTVGRSLKQVKSVTVNNPSLFTVTGSATPEIAVGSTDNTSFTIKPVDGLAVGMHEAIITVTDMQDNSYTADVTFEVEKAGLTPTVSIEGWTYGAEANTPSITGNAENGTVSYEYKVKGSEDDTYSTTVPENAGDYTLRATIAETTNYNSASDDMDFTISKKTVTFTVMIENQVFDDYELVRKGWHTLSEVVPINTPAETYFKEGSDKYVGTQIGVYELTLTDEAFKNYTFAEGQTGKAEDEFEITPAPSTLTIKSDKENPKIVKTKTLDLSSLIDLSNTYTNDITYTATDLKTGITLDGSTLSASSEAVANQVSKITAKFTGKDLNDDGTLEYSASPDLIIDVKTIDKPLQTLNEILSDVEVEYGLNYSNPISIATGNGTLSYSSSNSAVASINATTGEITIQKVGTTTITITASETDDYAETAFTYDLEVTAKPLIVTIGTFKITKPYDGTITSGTKSGAFAIVGIVNNDDVAVTVTPQDYSTANVHDDENQTLTLSLIGEDKANYSLGTASLSILCEITKKAITPTITVASGVSYDGSAKTPSVTVKDVETSIDSSEYDLEYSNNIDAGTGSVKVTAKSTSNYTWTEIIKNFEINKGSYNESITYTKNILENNEKVYNIFISDLNLPAEFKNAKIKNYSDQTNINNVFATSPGSLIVDGGNSFQFNTNSVEAGKTDTVKLVISSDNYEDVIANITVKAIAKTLIIIEGLTYANREYNTNPMVPTGTLTHTGYTGTINVLYEGIDGNTYSSANAPTDAGRYKVTYSIPSDNETYTGSKVYTFEIYKADPIVSVPQGLTGIVDNMLSTITLSGGFWWTSDGSIIKAGTNNYSGGFTPSDLKNYNVVSNISIPVYGKSKYDINTSVVGGNGTITPYSFVVEGDNKVITFTPSNGYMIDTVKINDELVTVLSNTYTISNITEHKNIVVTYKKIPFTITVNEVMGATITPNGTINVVYGDNKEIIITANLGYKLTSVKVNNEEKLPLTENKITITNITENQEVVVTVEKIEKIEYDVINGSNQLHTIGTNKDVMFKIDADKDLFLKVYLNDEELDSVFYTITEGSTIITLKQDFLNNLLPGTYNLKATFTNGGEANATFVVALAKEYNPKTGDSIITSIILVSVSLIGLLGVGLYLKNRNA